MLAGVAAIAAGCAIRLMETGPMPEKQTAPYGAWRSPITSDMIASGTRDLGQIRVDGDDIYWIEMRPAEQGRCVIVRRTPDGRQADVTPPPFNARTRAHEYGGGAYAVADGTVYFANFADQRLYRQPVGGAPEPIVPEANMRYADFVVDRARNRLIAVREDHTTAAREARTTIVAIDLAPGGRGGRVLVSGSDFYASPRVSPDGKQLAWLAWNHPNMPWDASDLWVGRFGNSGTVTSFPLPGKRGQHSLMGNEVAVPEFPESIFQPEWSPDGALYFVSDRTGWWNLYRWRDGAVEPVVQREAEFGAPAWVFGMSTYAFESAGRIVCAYNEQGVWRLARIDTRTRAFKPIDSPYTALGEMRAAPGRAVFLAASPREPASVVRMDTETNRFEVLRCSTEIEIDDGFLSPPEVIEFPTAGDRTAFGFYYPPRNRDFAAPAGERPPLLVMTHGGPTGAVPNALKWSLQYWTSRGFAVLDVNYGGSTGYGRAYRARLRDNWGIVDVDDVVNGALHLARRGLVDPQRLAIRGGSAGGYTTLAALTFRDVFRAGASYYGVSDLEALAVETHKFESRYLDGLIGPYPARRDLYLARSPIHHAEGLDAPVIFFQGLEDKVVPPNQAERMVEVLRAKGIPVAYVPFEGEQHGFRRAQNIKRSLDAELYFYSRVFGFEPAEAIEPVAIENL